MCYFTYCGYDSKDLCVICQMPGRVYNLSTESAESCGEWTAMLSHTLTLISDIKVSICIQY